MSSTHYFPIYEKIIECPVLFHNLLRKKMPESNKAREDSQKLSMYSFSQAIKGFEWNGNAELDILFNKELDSKDIEKYCRIFSYFLKKNQVMETLKITKVKRAKFFSEPYEWNRYYLCLVLENSIQKNEKKIFLERIKELTNKNNEIDHNSLQNPKKRKNEEMESSKRTEVTYSQCKKKYSWTEDYTLHVLFDMALDDSNVTRFYNDFFSRYEINKSYLGFSNFKIFNITTKNNFPNTCGKCLLFVFDDSILEENRPYIIKKIESFFDNYNFLEKKDVIMRESDKSQDFWDSEKSQWEHEFTNSSVSDSFYEKPILNSEFNHILSKNGAQRFFGFKSTRPIIDNRVPRDSLLLSKKSSQVEENHNYGFREISLARNQDFQVAIPVPPIPFEETNHSFESDLRQLIQNNSFNDNALIEELEKDYNRTTSSDLSHSNDLNFSNLLDCDDALLDELEEDFDATIPSSPSNSNSFSFNNLFLSKPTLKHTPNNDRKVVPDLSDIQDLPFDLAEELSWTDDHPLNTSFINHRPR